MSDKNNVVTLANFLNKPTTKKQVHIDDYDVRTTDDVMAAIAIVLAWTYSYCIALYSHSPDSIAWLLASVYYYYYYYYYYLQVRKSIICQSIKHRATIIMMISAFATCLPSLAHRSFKLSHSILTNRANILCSTETKKHKYLFINLKLPLRLECSLMGELLLLLLLLLLLTFTCE